MRGARMDQKTLIAVLVVSCAAHAPLRADLPAISLTAVFPPGARAGTTVEVSVAGDDLDGLAELRFSHPGVFARPAVDAAGVARPNRFVVAVAPDVPPGACDVRAVGRFGISSPRTFVVGDLPEAVERPGNESPGGATAIAADSVVNGTCAASAVDHFTFAAKAGQRVLVSCAAGEIDARTEPVVVLSDAAGRELGRSRTGGVIDFAPTVDGSYLLRVHDATFRGGPAFFYRLSVSTGPHVDFILPPAGRPGTRGRYVLYGRNLPNASPAEVLTADGKPLQQLPVEIELPAAEAGAPGPRPARPAQVFVRGHDYRLRTERGWSNPVFIAFTDAAPRPEPDANDAPEAAGTLAPPVDVAGQFFPQRDCDWFTFDAKKGEVWWVDVLSHRLGAAADPFLLVQRVTKTEKGEARPADVQEVYDADANAGGADFNTSTRDPAYRLEAQEDATYRLQVRDLFNTTRDDARLTYLLSVRKEDPDFRLVAAPVRTRAADLPANALLRRGGATPLRVVAVRRDGFNGRIDLSVEGLPPGVSCAGASIPPGDTSASLLLVAAGDAAAWAGPLRIVGRADVAGKATAREAAGACVVVNAGEPPAEAGRSRLTADFAAAVSAGDPAPLAVGPAEAKPLDVPAGGKAAVPLKLAWRSAGSGKVKLKAAGHPLLDNAAEVEVDANAAAATVEFDPGRHKLPPGAHTLYVRAEAKVKYARDPEAAKAAEDARAVAEKAAADAAAAARAAAEKGASAKAGADAEAIRLAERAAADAADAAKAAEQRKSEAVARANELSAKDVDGVFYSTPIVLNVLPPTEKK